MRPRWSRRSFNCIRQSITNPAFEIEGFISLTSFEHHHFSDVMIGPQKRLQLAVINAAFDEVTGGVSLIFSD